MLCVPRRGRRRFALAVPSAVCVSFAVFVLSLLFGACAARAGTWTLVSCTGPTGTPAPVDGWRPSLWAGGAATGSGAIDNCAAGGSLTAVSSAAAAPFSFSGPEWVFTAPAGSTIAGGTITASLTAPQGQTWIGSPNPGFDGGDVMVSCTVGAPCGDNGTLNGAFPITHLGGTRLYAPALCVDYAAPLCPASGVPGAVNAEVDIHAADILLSTVARPTAVGVTGSLLDPRVHGTATLRFTARDPLPLGGSGPGIYSVSATLDGATVYSATPSQNHGRCIPLGSAPTGLEFTSAQPCPPEVPVAIHIDTSALSDGPHTLAVSVGDAAANAATVLTRTIRTFNPVLTPQPGATGPAARLLVGYTFAGRHTTLDSVRAQDLPARGQISVRCVGRRCPVIAPTSGASQRPGRLWSAIKAARFTAGQRLEITISEISGHGRHRTRSSAETIILRSRAGARPAQRLG